MKREKKIFLVRVLKGREKENVVLKAIVIASVSVRRRVRVEMRSRKY